METEVIKLLISSYFSLSKRTLIDMVPKGAFPVAFHISSSPVPLLTLHHSPPPFSFFAAIMLNLVFHAKDDLQRELLGELYKPDVIEDILKESDSVVTRRKECIKFVAPLPSHLSLSLLPCLLTCPTFVSNRMIAALTKSEAICASVG